LADGQRLGVRSVRESEQRETKERRISDLKLEISEDFRAVGFSEFAPVAGGEVWGEMELTDGYSEEAESWEADSGGHFADLAVTAFVECEF
jgi:hypothetical protein